MNEIKKISVQDLIPIREIKEEINLIMFNSPLFTTQQLFLNNQIMEAIANVEIQINPDN